MVTDDAYGGPIDYIVFSFPPGADAGAGFESLLARVDTGTISILDLEVIGRADDGSGTRLTVLDLPIADRELAAVFDGAESGVLDDADLNAVGAALEPGWVAVAIVYEERSFADAAEAWDQAGGRLLLAGGVEPETLDEALADTADYGKED